MVASKRRPASSTAAASGGGSSKSSLRGGAAGGAGVSVGSAVEASNISLARRRTWCSESPLLCSVVHHAAPSRWLGDRDAVAPRVLKVDGRLCVLGHHELEGLVEPAVDPAPVGHGVDVSWTCRRTRRASRRSRARAASRGSPRPAPLATTCAEAASSAPHSLDEVRSERRQRRARVAAKVWARGERMRARG